MPDNHSTIPGVGRTPAPLTPEIRLSNSKGVSLDEAVADIIASGEEFTFPNVDLLIQAAMDTPWDN